jgi:hypothetical protein
MNILYINTGMHIKNDYAIKNYKNINLHISNTIEVLNNLDLKHFDCIYSPALPIEVSKYPNVKFIFGPHFSVFPENPKIDIIKGKNVIYIQPSEWARDVWRNNSLCNEVRIESLSFGVDTDKFEEKYQIQERSKVFLYFKRRMPNELNGLLQFLNYKNIEVKIFDYVSRYSEEEYLHYLQHSKFGIWLDAHESQGFALEEALSCNVPLLVWNIRTMKQEFNSNYDYIPATTIPYWDERCGEYFYEIEELERTFELFMSKLETYEPRKYVLENLSIHVCENKLTEIIKNI